MFSYSPFHYSLFGKTDSTTSAAPNTEVPMLNVLANLFVTCPHLTQREDEEHKRILFYHPIEETAKRKAEVTGMAEAIINFTGELIRSGATDADCDSDLTSIGSSSTASELQREQIQKRPRFLTSGKTKVVVIPLEGQFILGATFNREKCVANAFHPHQKTLLRILENVYEMFRLFNGRFSANFDDKSPKAFMQKLQTFFVNFLPTVNVSTVPFVDHLDGIGFMPLHSTLFLETQCFVDQCAHAAPQLKQAVFMYQNKLAQFSIEQRKLPTFMRFLTNYLIPHALAEELQPGALPTQQSRFVSASFDFVPSRGPYPMIQFEEEETGELNKYYVIAYRSLNATLCMLLPLDEDVNAALSQLHAVVEPRISEIASSMGDAVTELNRPSATNIPFHFIYHNFENFSFRTSLKILGSQATTIAFTPEVNTAIYEAYDKFIDTDDETAQLDLKVEGDLWVGFKRANDRLVIIFVPNSTNSSLEDMNAYFNQILQTHFDHIHIT